MNSLFNYFRERFPALLAAVVAGLLCLPFLHAVYWLGDEGIWLHGATRLSKGHRLYADFFEVSPPLGFLVLQGWLEFVGNSLLTVRILTGLTIAGTAYLTFRCCHLVTRSLGISMVLTLAWAVSSQGVWTQTNHHWFTTFLSMVCLNGLISQQITQRRSFLMGLAAGMAMSITTSRGALTVLAGLISIAVTGNRKTVASYIAGVLIVGVAIVLYIIERSTLVAAFRDVIGFAAVRYSSIQAVTFGHGYGAQNSILLFAFPLAALLALAAMAPHRRHQLGLQSFKTASAFAVAGFIGCFPRPDIVHISFAVPLTLPLLAIGIAQFHFTRRQGAILLLAAACMVAPSAWAYARLARAAVEAESTITPVGSVAFVYPRGEPELVRAIARLPEHEEYLFYPYSPMLPFLTDRQNVSRTDVLVPQYSTPAQYADACATAMENATWVVIDRLWADPMHLQSVFPAMVDPNVQEKALVERALKKGFRLVAVFGDYELRRRSMADPTLCEGM